MQHFLTSALHLFVVLMMASFIIGGILALSGTYDHWGSRYVLKARRSRLIRQRAKLARQQSDDSNVRNLTPYKSKKPNKYQIVYAGRNAA